jgi:membrane-bound lytic murein transglycosylase D
MRFYGLLFLLLLNNGFLLAQTPVHLQRPGDTLNKDPFVNAYEQSLMMFYREYAAGKGNFDSIVAALNYEKGDIPAFTDEEYCARLEEMNKMSPFHLDCNTATLSTIKMFASKRRMFISVALGRSELYFDLFEEKLAEYGLPLELKYLPVIESGLRPQVKSKAGALGLWQFMYRTGEYYGLKENSYIDERMDPAKATDAACRFLKKLYGIYGDWNLALAAYNAGPGNVNHAIRRSGNKKTYWEVRPFLPTETQGYVPNFIAAAYLMTYHGEHNIRPSEVKLNYNILDTVCLRSAVHMTTIERLISWPLDDIKALNPIYKTGYIPQTNPPQCISGPLDRIGVLVGLEDSLYKLERSIYNPAPANQVKSPVVKDTLTVDSVNIVDKNRPHFYHTVKSGETITALANKYKVSADSLKIWNQLQSSTINNGQRLIIMGVNKSTPPPPPPPPPPAKKYYTVKSGDTFSRIADRHNVSVNELKKLNPGINISLLRVGQRIRVK